MAYAKTNEDGTVSAETEQYEGNAFLAGLFGRKKGDKRPKIVAKKVDQYKKEMLTYIAHRIAKEGMNRNVDYGSHISVVITGGVWYIALNSDCNVNKDDLNRDAQAVKEDIKKKWRTIESKLTRQDFEGNVKEDIELAKKQALYITYRWAGKEEKEVVVSPNEPPNNGGVRHGEMATIDHINKRLDPEIYALACEISCCRDDESRLGEYSELWGPFLKKIKEKYQKKEEECYIIGNDIINEFGRVVRVGGTKTPCFDCAYEMDVHNDKIPEDDSSVHEGHQAENIGGRRAVTMTPEYGDAFAHWHFHNAARPNTAKNDSSLSHNSNQDQDYNELYKIFNSITDSEKMSITDSMLDVWEKRKMQLGKDKEEINQLNEGEKKNIDDLDYNQLNFLKLEMEKKLSITLASKTTNYANLNIADSKDEKLDICIQAVNRCVTAFSTNKADPKNVVKFYRSVINLLNVNIQKKLAEDELKDINREDRVRYGNLKKVLDYIQSVKEFCNYIDKNCQINVTNIQTYEQSELSFWKKLNEYRKKLENIACPLNSDQQKVNLSFVQSIKEWCDHITELDLGSISIIWGRIKDAYTEAKNKTDSLTNLADELQSLEIDSEIKKHITYIQKKIINFADEKKYAIAITSFEDTMNFKSICKKISICSNRLNARDEATFKEGKKKIESFLEELNQYNQSNFNNFRKSLEGIIKKEEMDPEIPNLQDALNKICNVTDFDSAQRRITLAYMTL